MPFEVLSNALMPVFKQAMNGSFKRITHHPVTLFTTRYFELPVAKLGAIWKRDHSVVKLESSQNPVWQDVFVIERDGVGAGAANETTAALNNIRNEALKTEEDQPAVSAYYALIWRNQEHGGRSDYFDTPGTDEVTVSAPWAGRVAHSSRVLCG